MCVVEPMRSLAMKTNDEEGCKSKIFSSKCWTFLLGSHLDTFQNKNTSPHITQHLGKASSVKMKIGTPCNGPITTSLNFCMWSITWNTLIKKGAAVTTRSGAGQPIIIGMAAEQVRTQLAAPDFAARAELQQPGDVAFVNNLVVKTANTGILRSVDIYERLSGMAQEVARLTRDPAGQVGRLFQASIGQVQSHKVAFGIAGIAALSSAVFFCGPSTLDIVLSDVACYTQGNTEYEENEYAHKGKVHLDIIHEWVIRCQAFKRCSENFIFKHDQILPRVEQASQSQSLGGEGDSNQRSETPPKSNVECIEDQYADAKSKSEDSEILFGDTQSRYCFVTFDVKNDEQDIIWKQTQEDSIVHTAIQQRFTNGKGDVGKESLGDDLMVEAMINRDVIAWILVWALFGILVVLKEKTFLYLCSVAAISLNVFALWFERMPSYDDYRSRFLTSSWSLQDTRQDLVSVETILVTIHWLAHLLSFYAVFQLISSIWSGVATTFSPLPILGSIWRNYNVR